MAPCATARAPSAVRNLHHPLGDEGAGNARPEKILAFVERPGLDHRENEFARELLTQVVHLAECRTRGQRLDLQAVEFLLLTHVRAERDHFRPVRFLQPTQNDRGIQPARISDDDFHRNTQTKSGSPGEKAEKAQAVAISGIFGGLRRWRMAVSSRPMLL